MNRSNTLTVTLLTLQGKIPTSASFTHRGRFFTIFVIAVILAAFVTQRGIFVTPIFTILNTIALMVIFAEAKTLTLTLTMKFDVAFKLFRVVALATEVRKFINAIVTIIDPSITLIL